MKKKKEGKEDLPKERVFTVCSKEVYMTFKLKFNNQFFADVIILKIKDIRR